MNHEQNLKMTDLDYLTAVPHLQMIKAALPYIKVPEQKFFSVLVKVSELERTIGLFSQKEDGAVGICSLEEDEPASPLDMLNAIKPYGTEEEQDFIDLITNFLQGSQLYQSYRDSAGEPLRTAESQAQEQERGQGQHPEEHAEGQYPGQEQTQHQAPGTARDGSGNYAGRQPQFGRAGNGFMPEDFPGEMPVSEENSNANRSDTRRFPIEQLKNMLPPDQQSKLETAQMLMQTFRQFS